MKVRKVLVLGLFGVGKTSLLKKFVEGTFSEEYQVTIGVHILKKTVEIKETPVKLILWDTEGVENIQEIRKSYFAGAHGFIYICDVSRPKSYSGIDEDLQYLKEMYPSVPVIVAANKSDLLEPGTIIDRKKEMSFVDFMVSAKEGSNVNRLFEKIAKKTTTP